jgi:hypothetical protein
MIFEKKKKVHTYIHTYIPPLLNSIQKAMLVLNFEANVLTTTNIQM